jgi:hypothetical protein
MPFLARIAAKCAEKIFSGGDPEMIAGQIEGQMPPFCENF